MFTEEVWVQYQNNPYRKAYTYIYVNTQQFCLTQLYFARGDMFRLLIQPSSGQLTIEQDL